MSSNKETALKWLIKKIESHPFPTTHGSTRITIPEEWVTVALEEEEFQIIDAWNDGFKNGYEDITTAAAENYYVDNFGYLR